VAASASPWAGRWFGVAVAAGVLAELCALAAVVLALVPARVTAGDVSYSCGRAFSVDGSRADDPLCTDAADGRKTWVLGVGAVTVVLGLVAVGAVIALAVVDPDPGTT
jgi:hypothetical protein